MTTTRHRFKVSFTGEELVRVQALAKQLRLSKSELLRRLALGHALPDASAFAGATAIDRLLTLNADQARLGNLLKLAIDEADQDFAPPLVARIEALVAEIRATQARLRAHVEDLHFAIHPRKRRP